MRRAQAGRLCSMTGGAEEDGRGDAGGVGDVVFQDAAVQDGGGDEAGFEGDQLGAVAGELLEGLELGLSFRGVGEIGRASCRERV